MKKLSNYNHSFQASCPACSKNNWREKKLQSMSSYFICNKCSLNMQEISESISKDDFFKLQQEHHFGDNQFLTHPSELLKKIDDEGNAYKLKIIKKYCSNFIEKEIVEIGSGPGSFAKEMEELDFKMTLIEESNELCMHLKQILSGEVINKNINKFNSKKKYDAACSFQVIEHVADLNEFLVKINSILKTDGLIFLSTPNADSFQHNLPYGLSPNFDSAHMFILSRNSIKLLLRKSGYEVLELTTPEYSSTWLRVASKILRRVLGKSETETAGEYITSSNSLHNNIYTIFKYFSFPLRYIQAKLGRGNEIFIVAKKV